MSKKKNKQTKKNPIWVASSKGSVSAAAKPETNLFIHYEVSIWQRHYEVQLSALQNKIHPSASLAFTSAQPLAGRSKHWQQTWMVSVRTKYWFHFHTEQTCTRQGGAVMGTHSLCKCDSMIHHWCKKKRHLGWYLSEHTWLSCSETINTQSSALPPLIRYSFIP